MKDTQSGSLQNRLTEAAQCIQSGEYGKAIEILCRLVSSKNADVLFLLGKAHQGNNSPHDAVNFWQQALAINPAHINSLISLGDHSFQAGEVDQGLSLIKKAYLLSNKHPGIRQHLWYVTQMALQATANRVHHISHSFSPLPEHPKVSIIIPTRNRPQLLSDALQSVQQQEYSNWEMVVVDASSGGEAEAVIESLSGSTVQYIQSGQNIGPGEARNIGILRASGDIICFLDDDDLYHPNHLTTLINGFHQANCSLVFTDTYHVTEQIQGNRRLEQTRTLPFSGIGYCSNLLTVRNYIPINTWAVRRECFELIGGFDEQLPVWEDWEFLLKLLPLGEFNYQNVVTTEFRSRPARSGQMSGKMADQSKVFDVLYGRYPQQEALITEARSLYIEMQVNSPR